MNERNRKAEFGDFQTPVVLANEVCALLRRLSIKPCTVVEPSCGEGSFLAAAIRAFGNEVRYFGFDINPHYVRAAECRFASEFPDAAVQVRTQDFFDFDWKGFVRTVPAPVLLLGNPPWVTNSTLGALGSANLPEKANIKALRGIAARTGKANFDISEWMLLKLLEAVRGSDYALAMLCKTAVARKVLEHQWMCPQRGPVSALYRIDAQRWFGAAVDACVFVAQSAPGDVERTAPVYASLAASEPSACIGLVDGQMVADFDAYQHVRGLNGISYYRRRSGVKHDLAKLMELRAVGGRMRNGLEDEVDIEETCLYPLLKAGDIAKGQSEPTRWVIITQTAVGQDTERLRTIAPRTWSYLEHHDALFAARKSSIYRQQPKYCLFGVGSYTFAPYKVAISGLHKELRFCVTPPCRGKPVILDDTSYFIGLQHRAEADLLCELLNSAPAQDFLRANIFADNKRPVTAELLNRLDVRKLAEHLGRRRDIEPFLQTGTVEAPGQGLFLFEPGARHALP